MPSVAAVCERFAATPFPAADVPSDSERPALRECDAEALYYGIAVPVDFVRARRCAYAQGERDGAPVFGSPEILMMIYANGQGVPANFDLALRFACKVGGAPAELGGRVSRLWEARKNAKLIGKLDICDDATSGYMSGYCVAHQERVDAVARNARKRSATTGMPAGELKALEQAAARYFEARSNREIDLSGTMSASFAIAELAHLEDELVKALERLRDPTFLPAIGDAKRLDSELASLTARLVTCRQLAQTEELVPGTISRAGIRETQTRWLAYRQAFVALALKLQPTSSRDAWRAWLNQARLQQLQELGPDC